MSVERKSDVLASNTDRSEAVSLLRRHHEEGRLTDDELEERLGIVRDAKTLGALKPVYAGLPSLGFDTRGAEHKLASDANREKAKTKLCQHHGEGRIGPEDFEVRMGRAGVAKTQAELDLLFKDLPTLGPARSARIPGNQYKRADDAQRNAATAELRRHKNAGRLSTDEFDARAVLAGTAETPLALKELLSDLPKLAPGGGVAPGFVLGKAKLRASNDDRDAAIRKLNMHAAQGHFATEAEDECERRVAVVQACTTPHEIDQVFSDLPPLTPGRPTWRERRIDEDDRGDAIRQLNDHLAKGRIEVDEHRIRVDQVRAAREREEINAAFGGLPRPGMVTAGKVVSDAAQKAADQAKDLATEGGRRAKQATKWVVLATAAFFSAVVMAFAGVGAAAAALMIGAIGLMVLAVRELAKGKPE